MNHEQYKIIAIFIDCGPIYKWDTIFWFLFVFVLITMGVHWDSSMWLHVACYTCTLLQLRHFYVWSMWPLHRGRHGLISSLLLFGLIVHMVCVYVCVCSSSILYFLIILLSLFTSHSIMFGFSFLLHKNSKTL